MCARIRATAKNDGGERREGRRREHRVDVECEHDVAIHSGGEIVNERGRGASTIEGKWGSLKRRLCSVRAAAK